MSSLLKPKVNAKDHFQGNEHAAIELVEYGDYQCPHCGHAYPIIKKIQKKLGTDLKFVFRNFPLSEIHPDAVNAAVATEAAALQEKYWEMHDIIFENQFALGKEDLIQYGEKISLNIDQFKTDLQNESLLSRVEDDFESGVRSGVNGTPSFFVNGKKYNGDWEEEEFIRFLKSII